MLTHNRLKHLLAPFGVELDPPRLEQVSAYLRLLMRWNERINLTAIRNEEEVVTRHFGESFFVARIVSLHGRLLDIGSGAGFPGLALKVAFPDLNVTLLEPVGKKRAFLKEVIRNCGIGPVVVRGDRLDEYAPLAKPFDTVTARAVGHLDELALLSSSVLVAGGRFVLWLSRKQAAQVARHESSFAWEEPLPVPSANEHVILVGWKRPQPVDLQSLRK